MARVHSTKIMNYRKQLGKWGEDQAVKLLEKYGYEIVERNFHTRYGEIDIIARQKNCLVFIEVKVRRTMEAASAIDERKQEKMLNTAQIYLEEHETGDLDIRFDCVILEKKGKKFVIQHLEDIIEAS